MKFQVNNYKERREGGKDRKEKGAMDALKVKWERHQLNKRKYSMLSLGMPRVWYKRVNAGPEVSSSLAQIKEECRFNDCGQFVILHELSVFINYSTCFSSNVTVS